MSQPTPYRRAFSFTGFSAASPTAQQPGYRIDAELDAVGLTLDGVRRNLALIQRDDGALANQSVGPDQLSTAALLLMSGSGFHVRGVPWSNGLVLAPGDIVSLNGVLYLAVLAHTATVLATDIAAGKITIVFDPSGLALMQALPTTSGATLIGTPDGSVQAVLDDIKATVAANAAALADPGGVSLVGGAFALDANGNLAIGLSVASDALVQIKSSNSSPNVRPLAIDQYASGVGNWAADIHVYQGGYGGIGGHCYSDRNGDPAGAVFAKFDHTRNGTILALSNARNQTTSPGTTGTADFLTLGGFPDTSVSLATNPVVLSQWTYQNIILTPQNAWPLTITGGGLIINAISTSPRGLLVNQGATGIYASIMAGQNYGLGVSTTTNGGQTLTVTKNGTGNGSAAVFVNEGIDPSIAGISGGVQGFAIYPSGDFYHGTTKVLGARGAALPAAATDAATTMALANAIRTCIQTHGLAA